MALMTKSTMKNVTFKECKLLGLHFQHCNGLPISAHFEGCILNLSSFYKLSLKKTRFKNCSLQEVDFAECDLSNATI